MWVSGASKNSEIKKQNVNTILTLIVFPKYWYWRVIYRYRRIKYRMHKFLNLEDIPNQLCFYDVRFCQKMYRHYNNDKFTTGTLLIMLLIISGISDITITGVNLDYLDYGINDRYYYKVDKLSAKQKRKMKIFTFIKKVINSKYVVYCPRHVHSYVDYKLKRIGFNHDFTKERKVLEQIVKQYKIKKL